MNEEISYISAVYDQVDAINKAIKALKERPLNSIDAGELLTYPPIEPGFTVMEGPLGDDDPWTMPWVVYIIAAGCKHLPIEDIRESLRKKRRVRVLLSMEYDASDVETLKQLIWRNPSGLPKEKDGHLDVRRYGTA